VPNKFVYSETGRYSLYINSDIRCIRYWLKLQTLDVSRFAKQAYVMLKNLDERGKLCWATHIKNSRRPGTPVQQTPRHPAESAEPHGDSQHHRPQSQRQEDLGHEEEYPNKCTNDHEVEDFVYLGSKVTINGDCDLEINTRISKAN
jgi:hypothetical protein